MMRIETEARKAFQSLFKTSSSVSHVNWKVIKCINAKWCSVCVFLLNRTHREKCWHKAWLTSWWRWTLRSATVLYIILSYQLCSTGIWWNLGLGSAAAIRIYLYEPLNSYTVSSGFSSILQPEKGLWNNEGSWGSLNVAPEPQNMTILCTGTPSLQYSTAHSNSSSKWKYSELSSISIWCLH